MDMAHAARPEKPGADSPAKANTVVIDNFTFAPTELTVPAGTEVTWVNRDDVPHTATSTAKPKAFDSAHSTPTRRFPTSSRRRANTSISVPFIR